MVQQASLAFFLPVAAAYLAACAAWYALIRLAPGVWPVQAPPTTDRPRLDFALALVAPLGVLLLGQLYRMGWLLPRVGAPPVRRLLWVANNLIIYAPLFLVLAARRQGLATVYLSARRLWLKVALGLALGALAAALFLALRGETPRLVRVLTGAADLGRLADFVPVFLEGVGLAFLLVRLGWLVGERTAALVPALLFAAAHIPSGLASGRTAGELAAFFAFNVALVTVILRVVQRGQDVVVLGLVHYVMDVAIEAI